MSARGPYDAACTCGQVMIEATGSSILSAACYCASCRTAARQFERVPGAPIVLNPDGAIDYCLFRQDRVRIVRGHAHLQAHRLTESSATRRIVASCCNAPMLLDFTSGHWLNLYRDRIAGAAPPIEMGVMAKDRPADPPPPDGHPPYPVHLGHPASFMIRLLLAWAKMGFRKPRLGW